MTSDPNASDDAKNRLSSVAAACHLLKVFTAQEPELGITVLAKRLGLAKSTVHRLATTLVAEGLLEQNPADGRYRLGITLFSLGTLVRRRMNVPNQARPFLDELREKTDETVHLAVLDQPDIIYLWNLESSQAIRMRSYLGVRKPAFCTSEGRAILAFSAPQVVAQVLRSGLVPRTPKTNVDAGELVKMLEEVRRNGYALDDEESEEGMRGIAAPIRDAGGQVVAAVGLAGPVQRWSRKALKQFVPLVIDTADNISTRLGHAAAA